MMILSNKLLPCFLSMSLLLSVGAMALENEGTSPEEVIARVIANSSQTPTGPLENDLAEETVQGMPGVIKSLGDSISFRDAMAPDYNFFTLSAAATPLYVNGSVAIYTAPIKINEAALKDSSRQWGFTPPDGNPSFGDMGGDWCYLGDKLKPDGHAIASFCLLQQHGLWKIHGYYLSNKPLNDEQKSYIVSQLERLTKKS